MKKFLSSLSKFSLVLLFLGVPLMLFMLFHHVYGDSYLVHEASILTTVAGVALFIRVSLSELNKSSYLKSLAWFILYCFILGFFVRFSLGRIIADYVPYFAIFNFVWLVKYLRAKTDFLSLELKEGHEKLSIFNKIISLMLLVTLVYIFFFQGWRSFDFIGEYYLILTPVLILSWCWINAVYGKDLKIKYFQGLVLVVFNACSFAIQVAALDLMAGVVAFMSLLAIYHLLFFAFKKFGRSSVKDAVL
ncbi:hypothetical protein JKY72_01685 [Candidatus Gracilibacteria bacterium]|nr:hypothetical protein [Candidatus Gracilibacteria bacterium]